MDNLKKFSDLALSEAIIRVRNQLFTVAPKLPDGGARLKANLKRMEDEQNRRNSIHVEEKHPKAKRFCTSGCSEVATVACRSPRASDRYDISSTDENGVEIEVPQSTSPSTSHNSTSFEEVESDDELYAVLQATQGGNRVEINESLKVLAEASKVRAEMRKRKLEDERKYSIQQCMKIMDEMEEIGDNAYIRVLKVLQDKGWRETFFHMSDQLRRVWISSI